jgi:cell wall-associated NlpC family hydrolase
MMVISGAMVASIALPAAAVTPTTRLNSAAPAALSVAVAAPSAAQAPLVPQSFGNIGFTGVVKPKPAPAPVPQPAVVAVSRSMTRAPITPVAAPAASGVLGIAASLAGTPYVYGGTTPSGFDCSGYTQYVFAKAGINLPRTAAAQQQAATAVSNPQPGDLVFFGSPADHVGIYAGNNMMWDSPHSGADVQLQSIWSSTVTYGRP